ncbi:hypothetical protein [Methylocystis sp.]|uniref:hypothetical protein n=1 Tax=Methylocystis sp. TaxID=1911079 RepID=UPI0025EA0B99|nr:hypothetical protein [Methylocystis sp.]
MLARAGDVTECSLQARHNSFRKLARSAPFATSDVARRRLKHAMRGFGVAAFRTNDSDLGEIFGADAVRTANLRIKIAPSLHMTRAVSN